MVQKQQETERKRVLAELKKVNTLRKCAKSEQEDAILLELFKKIWARGHENGYWPTLKTVLRRENLSTK